jgi:fucose 4-O-acetylase-like acetyltransferase
MREESEHDLRIHILDTLRGIAILMVVAIHAMPYSGLSEEIGASIRYFMQIAVPAFFFVDGYLFGYKAKQTLLSYPLYAKKSARRLLVPWLIFSLIYLLFRGGFEYLGYLPQKVVLGRDAYDIIKGLYLSTISSQMYFLLSLFIVRMLAALSNIARAPYRGVILIFISSAILWDLSADWLKSDKGFDPLVHAFWGLQYYLLGLCTFAYRETLIRQSSKLLTFLIVAYGLNKIVQLGFGWIDQYAQLLLVYVILIKTVQRENWLTNIGRLTMGIYILHIPVIMKGVSIVVATTGSDQPILNFAVITIVTAFISINVTRVMMLTSLGRFMLGYINSDRLSVPISPCKFPKRLATRSEPDIGNK